MFITSVVSLSFCILFKNMKLALYMMYIVHLYGGFYTQLFLGLFFCRLKLLSSNFPRVRTFFLGFSFPQIYFLQYFFLEILFPETLLAAPILF